MKPKKLNRWLIGGVTFFLICAFPLPVFCQQASIKDVRVKGTSGAWKVSFSVENCFTVKMEEGIQSGIGTTFTFYLHVYQKRSWWKDRKVASVHFHHAIQFDPIRAEYRVTLEENSSTVVTPHFEEAKGLMAKVEGVEVVSSSPLKPDVSTQLHIKAELDPVRLPLHLEYLLFFVSLWNFETDWHIESLPP
jgi:hypothetical protein